jgi:hypothetical protein
MGDWPSWTAPTEEQVDEIRRGRNVVCMRAELRHQYGDVWVVDVVEDRVGGRATFFSDYIDARAGGECEAAAVRLEHAGQPGPWTWIKVDGGWDGQRG